MAGLEDRIVTFSRNVFIPVTNVCRNRCMYCGFWRDPGEGWLMRPEEVMELAGRAKMAGCSEALITLGEKPEAHPAFKQKLLELGYETMVDYLVDLCRAILGEGLLPHTNAGVLSYEELRRLRRYNASMGLMLECAVPLPVHEFSPGKDPGLRLEVLRNAGELRIPFTTGLLIGIGERREDRLTSLKAIKRIHEETGHIQEVIIQPFAPKAGTPMENASPPPLSEILWTVKKAREILEDVPVQVPPNLVEFSPAAISSVLEAGARDFGGLSPVTPDFINPEHPWPDLAELKSVIGALGFTLRERLPIYPKFAVDERFTSEEVRTVVRSLSDEEGYRLC